MKMLAKLFLLLAMFAQMALGTELVGKPEVATKDGTATVKWKTTDPSGTVVKFGTDAKNLLRKASGELGDQHNVVLENLQPGTTYFYEVCTAKRSLGQFSFTTPGKPEAKEENKPLLKKIFGFLDTDKPKETKEKPAEEAPAKALPKQKPIPKELAKPAATAPLAEAPPTRSTWGYMGGLQDHFDRHGADFKSKTPDEYAAQAWRFLQKALDEGLPVKQDPSDGTLRVWEASTRTFAAYNADLTTKTFFRPNSPDYFERQPGKKVKLVRKK